MKSSNFQPSEPATNVKLTGYNKSETDLGKSEVEDAVGEFDEDEAVDAVMAARAAKGGNTVKVRYEVYPFLSFS